MKASSRVKDRDNNRSIDVTRDEDNLSENEEANEAALDKLSGLDSTAHSAWEMGGQHRDHVIQNLLYLGSQLGFYRHVASGPVEEKVFYRGIYAPDEVDAIRSLLINEDDPVHRQLMVYVSSIKMIPQFLVPLFYQSVDEKPFAVSLIRLFLLLTRPLAKSMVDASSHIIKKTKGKETNAESQARVVKEQAERQSAYNQIAAHLAFKEALVNENVFVVLLKFLEDPLSKPSHGRTDEDKIIIESILTLVNNLLRISAGPFSSPTEAMKAAVLHNKLILVLQGEFMDIIILLCQGIMERSNNPWRVILVEIVHFILSDRDAKDLYKIYASEIADTSKGKNPKMSDSSVAKPVSAGALTQQLKQEKESRLAVSRQRMSNRHSRFSGQFVVPSTLAPPTNPVEPEDSSVPGQRKPLPPAKNMIVSNPFADVFNRRDGPRRSEKRSAPFNVDDARSNGSLLSVVGGHGAQAEEEQRASRVVTHFLQDFLENAFSELVFSVKEGWRRGVDESDGMTGEEELRYYRMITTCLKFHRLKQLAEQKKSDLATRGNGAGSGMELEDDRWAPDLRCVTQCFDRMSFIRPVDFMNRLKKIDKKPECIVYAMELYTELVCYLRLMVESIEPAHNDIALAALYKIFYIRQEREDPLPTLFREWTAGTYGRRHLVGLVALAHEIMKTLDAARTRFREEARLEGLSEGMDGDNNLNAHALAKKKKRKKSNDPAADSERSMYLAAGCQFEPEEYLKRSLATNQAVRIYTSLLELYHSNTPAVNYYVQIFIQRLTLFKIEDDGFGDVSAGDPQSCGVSLGHMFFNIKSLHAFNTLLQDSQAERDSNLQPLVRLIKQLVQRFGALVQKNRLAFVEALFPPSFPSHHSFLTVVDSVYDAKRYAIGGRGDTDPRRTEGGHQDRGSDSALSDYGDEFDENEEYATRVGVKPQNPDKLRKKSSKRASGAPGKWTWSKEEDQMLKEKYRLYAGTHSVFDMISNDEEFKALGGNRTKIAIEKRVRALNLHLSYASDLEDEPEMESSASDSEEREMSSSSSSSDEVAPGNDGEHDQMDVAEEGQTREKSKKRNKKEKRRRREKKKDNKVETPSRRGDSSSVNADAGPIIRPTQQSPVDVHRDAADDSWLGEDSSGDEKWTGLRAFRPKSSSAPAATSPVPLSSSKATVAAAPTTHSATVLSLSKKRKFDDDEDDIEWGDEDTRKEEGLVGQISKISNSRARKVLGADDSDEE